MFNMKLVDFDKYCHNCKHKDTVATEYPCFECLGIPARQFSHKPQFFEDARSEKKEAACSVRREKKV